MPTFIYVVSIQVLDTDHGESTRKTAYYSTIGTANEAALKVALARLKETSKKETYRVKKKEWSKMAESPKKLFSTRGRSGYDHWKVRVRRESIQGPDIRTLPEEEEELEGDAEDGEEDEEEYEYEDGEDEDEVTRAEKEFVDEDEEEEERARRLRKRKRARYDLE
ncbi:uncharacterized protein STEHIDRAFT_145947 [Stereum hirsutum FP-91666 SS1]|uniref:uncharacterized protein n=1 Tax=Stereum hirsutum (strain FP-91666) TaxID=721885 RepID=UPI000440DEF0|nr:uncharacterized protein STEHIDRAFT_145947 [Stereum hirsutum FP-91666 SS1]EIM89306.1 hypothetical protein STEHIDRAFT_145947 [Stereum hirsutum FP-91666 SS1]